MNRQHRKNRKNIAAAFLSMSLILSSVSVPGFSTFAEEVPAETAAVEETAAQALPAAEVIPETPAPVPAEPAPAPAPAEPAPAPAEAVPVPAVPAVDAAPAAEGGVRAEAVLQAPAQPAENAESAPAPSAAEEQATAPAEVPAAAPEAGTELSAEPAAEIVTAAAEVPVPEGTTAAKEQAEAVSAAAPEEAAEPSVTAEAQRASAVPAETEPVSVQAAGTNEAAEPQTEPVSAGIDGNEPETEILTEEAESLTAEAETVIGDAPEAAENAEAVEPAAPGQSPVAVPAQSSTAPAESVSGTKPGTITVSAQGQSLQLNNVSVKPKGQVSANAPFMHFATPVQTAPSVQPEAESAEPETEAIIIEETPSEETEIPAETPEAAEPESPAAEAAVPAETVPEESGVSDSIPAAEGETTEEFEEPVSGEIPGEELTAENLTEEAAAEEPVIEEAVSEEESFEEIITEEALTEEAFAEEESFEEALTEEAFTEEETSEEALPEDEFSGIEIDNDTMSALQKAINEKIASMSTLNERITIKLNKDTIYEGDIKIEKDDEKTYGENFGIDLVSEVEAGEDSLQADGSSVVKGDITVKGINVLFRGVSLALGKKISVEDGTVEYLGSTAADTVELELKSGASATVKTGEGADTVKITTAGGAKSVNVATGNGDDKITATLNGGTAEINSEAGSNTIEVTVNEGVKDPVTITAGDDGNTVSVTASGKGTVTVNTGAGGDTVNINAVNKSDLSGPNIINVNTGDGNDSVNVKGSGSYQFGTINIVTPAGMNTVTIDTSVAGAAAKVNLTGGDSVDALHLTGSLNSSVDADKRITGTANNLTLETGKKLNIVSTAFDRLTDTLANKKTVRLHPDFAAESFEYNAGDANFVNYSIESPVNHLSSIRITTNGGAPILSNVIIDTMNTGDDDDKLVIHNLEAIGLNLVLTGEQINFEGTVKAGDIRATAADNATLKSFSDYYAERRAEFEEQHKMDLDTGNAVTNTLAEGSAELATNAAGLYKTLTTDVFNVNHEAGITIGKDAAIYSSGNVSMDASVVEEGGIISLLPGMNLVNVKIAKASIDVAGKIYAGYDFANNKTGTGMGSVSLKTDVKINAGYDSDGKGYEGLPLAITVGSLDSDIHVRQGAVIEAAGDVALSANGNVKTYTRADSGLGGLPLALAVSILNSDVNAIVDGTVTAGKNVKVNAAGTLDSITIADKGSGQKSLSGGYVAVSVALQDVKAELGKTAVVNAKGSVSVNSKANETAKNTAASNKQEGGNSSFSGGIESVTKLITDNWDAIKGFIKSESAQEKLDKAISKMSSSTGSVKLDSQASKKGEAKLSVENANNKKTAVVEVTPWPGWKVKNVYWRALNPGDTKYTRGTTTKSGNKYSFPISMENTTVFVEYEENTIGEDLEEKLSINPSDLFEERPEGEDEQDFEIRKIFEDATDNTSDEDDDDDIFAGLSEMFDSIPLKLTGNGGAVLTYDENPEKAGESLAKVLPGQKIEFVVNPSKGKVLKKNGLVMTIKYNDGTGKQATKKIVITQNDEGRYITTLPENAEGDVTVTAEFVDSGSKNAEEDKTSFAATGAIAVIVATNDNNALIQNGAKVTASKNVAVSAEGSTDISNTADGSAADKSGDSSSSGKKEDKSVKKADQKTYTGFISAGLEYGLIIDETGNGKVTYNPDEVGGYTYTFTSVPDEGYAPGTFSVSFVEGGAQKTIELKADSDGKYRLNLLELQKSSKALDQGSTVHVRQVFTKDGAVVQAVNTYGKQAVVANPVKVSYNTLKFSKEADPKNEKYDFIGKVYCKRSEDGKYIFTIEPDTSRGFTINDTDSSDSSKSNKAALWVSWKDSQGAEQKAALKKASSGWYFDASGKDIPAGALLTVNVLFTEDQHAIKIDSNFKKETAHGSITLYDSRVKPSDEVTITVKPDGGYDTGTVKVTFKTSAGTKTEEFKPGENGDVKVKIPELMAGSEITVTCNFEEKNIGLEKSATVDGKAADSGSVSLSESIVNRGNKVNVTLSSDLTKKGYKVSNIELSYTDENKKAQTKTVSGDSFEVPKDANNDKTDGKVAQIKVKANLVQKEIALTEAKLSKGTITPDTARADRGDLVTVTIKPQSGYRVKSDTVKAVIKEGTSSSTEIYLDRKNDTTYTFILPTDITTSAKPEFTAEFEEGNYDSGSLETSIGASIAVTVALAENNAEIKSGSSVTGGGTVSTEASAKGGASTETKAGYSKGNVGIGGAISVQVASMDARALMHKNAVISAGGIKADATSDLKFSVKGNAAGSTAEAKSVGVGAGIAVAVNSADAFAGVEDGVQLSGNIADIAINASQKISDTVEAKAGSKGGTSVTPVAAVDVAGTTAYAYMGRVKGDALKASGTVSLSATNTSTHTISADASAAGAGAGFGGAFDVAVLSESAIARLNQSLDAGKVTVSSSTESTVKSSATASASGGEKAKSSSDGKQGKADKQADGLLSGASKLAGRSKSKSVSADKVGAAANNRQKAQTSEGSVAGAGAIVVNIQGSESRAEILNGVNVKSAGLLAVTSQNRTVSEVKANASTTKSNIGVGVGVAVNVLNLKNIASIGDGEIEAAILEVSATVKDRTKKEGPTTVKEITSKDGLVAELTEKLDELIRMLIDELGLSQYEFFKGSTLTDLVNSLVEPIVKDLLKTSGLGDLLGDGNLKAKYDKAVSYVTDAKDGLLSLPEKLAEPFMEAYREIVGTVDLTDAEKEQIKKIFIAEFTTQLNARSRTAATGVLNAVKDNLIKYVKDNAWDIVTGLGDKATYKKVLDKALEAAKEGAKKQLTKLAQDTLKDTIQKLSTQLPALTPQNIEKLKSAFTTVKDAYQQKSMSDIYGNIGSYISETFRENVFDYEEMISKLSQTDFKKTITEGLRSAAKKGMVSLTNEMTGKLLGLADVALTVEDLGDRHVVNTQAIAGAGAKDTGVAGSVAVTVLNADTLATIAASSKKLEVSGKLSMEANEKRKVNSVASAALDAKGNASANKSAGNNSKNDVTGGENKTITGKGVKVTTGVGGKAEIKANNANDKKPYIYITPDKGYKVADGGKVTYTYSNSKDYQVSGTIDVKKDGNTIYIDPKSGELAGVNEDVELELAFAENLHTVGVPSENADKISVSAPGRNKDDDKKNDDNTHSISEDKVAARAKEGDLVYITAKKQEGKKIDKVTYTYTDASGKSQTAEAKTIASSNATEIVYAFEMPNADVDSVKVTWADGSDESASDSEAKDSSGKSVGVGAAFSMVYGGSDVKASVGSRSGSLKAGAVSIKAASNHDEDIASVAGSDPLAGETDRSATKDFALDASIALNILDNDVYAGIDGGKLTTTGYTDAANNNAAVAGDVVIASDEQSHTQTNASAFAVGSSTAVGASAAVNVALTDVKAGLSAAEAAGKVSVTANSHSEDNTAAIATAMGADIQRNLDKVNSKVKSGTDSANKLMKGDYLNEKAKDKTDKTNSNNDTSKKITNRLNKTKADGGSDASNNLSVSSNVARTQNINTEGSGKTKEATDQVNTTVKDKTGLPLTGSQDEKKDSKLQVAAAIGVTVTSHAAGVTLGGDVKGTSVEAKATNSGNFNTMGTAASMSLEREASSIAAGIAVSVNLNEATVDTKGDVVATAGDVTLTSDLTQNMDGKYLGLLGAQALAGAVSGKGSDVSIGGAIAVEVSKAKVKTTVAGSSTGTRNISGDTVTVSAQDKSKLAVRAGGISVSKGSSVGIGVAVASVWGRNDIQATVGDNTRITAKQFDLIARKNAVTMDDFKLALGLSDLVTDSSKLNDEQRKNANTGLFDLKKGEKDDSYTLSVNLSTDKLLDAVNLLNFLSSTNYYAEAIAGSLMMGGETDANLAGSFIIVDADNTVKAALGKKVIVDVTKNDKTKGEANIESASETNARLIGGAAAIGSGKNSAGVTVTYFGDRDTVDSAIGDGSSITADAIKETASATGSIQNFNVAASVTLDKASEHTIGGAINVILTKNKANTTIGNEATLTSRGALGVKALTDMDQILVSVSLAGALRGTAAGGTVAVVVDKAESNVTIGNNHRLEGEGDVTIAADTKDRMTSVLASASAGLSPSGTAAAGAINVLISNAKGKVALGSGGEGKGLISNLGNVAVTGNAETRAVNVTVSAAGSTGKAVGASLNVNVFGRESGVDIKGGTDYIIKASKDILTAASGRDTTVLVGLAAAAAATDDGYSGNIQVLVSENNIKNNIGEATITAGGDAAFAADLEDRTYGIAGSIALSGFGDAAGATIVVAVKESEIATDIGKSIVTVNHTNKGSLSEKVPGKPDFSGLYIGANVKDTTILAAAGVVLSGSKGVTGNLNTFVNSSKVKANSSQAVMTANNGAAILQRAKADSMSFMLAGGISIGASDGIGASAVTMVSGKEVESLAGSMTADSDVTSDADNHDDIMMLALSAGGGGDYAVQMGIAVQVLRTKVHNYARAGMVSRNGSINLKGNNKTDLVNAAAALAAAGNGAISPVAVVTYFKGETLVEAGPEVKEDDKKTDNADEIKFTAAKNINITANSDKDIRGYTIGASFGGNFGLSGAANVIVAKDKTLASANYGSELEITGSYAGDKDAEGNPVATINIDSSGAYKLEQDSGVIAGAGATAVAVNAVVSVMKGRSEAQLAGIAKNANAINLQAKAARDVRNIAATIAASGTAAVGATVMVLVAGEKMSQDANNTLVYGNGSKEDREKGKKTFDALQLLKTAELQGIDVDELGAERDRWGVMQSNELVEDLAGDGQSDSTMQVGESGKAFDASSGYRSNEFDDTKKSDDTTTQRGEKQTHDESADIKGAKTQGIHRLGASEDFVQASIADTAVVTTNKGGKVNVTAYQPTMADLFGGTVSLSAGAGIGASVAVAMVHSNVYASSYGTINAEEGTVNVVAKSIADSTEIKEDTDEASRLASIKKNSNDDLFEGLDPSKRSIRAIGLAVAGGTAGIGAAVSVVRADNVTDAQVGGAITGVKSLTVEADSHYENVMAATLAVGAGVCGVSASVAIAQAEGTVGAKLDGTTRITGSNLETLDIKTDSIIKANSFAAGAAGGLGAVNAGVSLASNRLNQNTGIDRGASIDVDSSNPVVNVLAKSDTRANSGALGVAVGLGAANINAAVSMVSPTINTTIGVNGAGLTTIDLKGRGSVNVTNDNSSSATPKLAALSAGIGALNGSALLAFNESQATAKVTNVTLKTGDLAVDSVLKATGESVLASATIGLAAVGINANYVDLHARNDAILDVTNSEVYTTKGLRVTTGGRRASAAEEDGYSYDSTSRAIAYGMTGTVGGISAGINVGIARNRTANSAQIIGAGSFVNDGTTTLSAYGKGITESRIEGLTISAGDISIGFTDALNETTSAAIMKLQNSFTNKGDLNIAATVSGRTNSEMITGGGSLMEVKTSVAVAYGKTHSLIDVDLAKAPESNMGAINVINNGYNNPTATVKNGAISALSLTGLVGAAYAQDVYDSNVRLGGGTFNTKGIKVETTSNSVSGTTIEPSRGGFSASLVGLNLSLATARSTVYAGSELAVADATIDTAGNDISVKTYGNVKALAEILAAKISVGGVKIASNQGNADVSSTQDALLTLNNATVYANHLDIQSLYNDMEATSSVGSSGREKEEDEEDEKLSITLVDGAYNTSKALEDAEATAGIVGSYKVEKGTTSVVNKLFVKDLSIHARMLKDTFSNAENKDAAKIGLFSGGVMKSTARSGDSMNVLIRGVDAEVTNDATILAETKTHAKSSGSSPGKLTAVDVSVSKITAGIGYANDPETAKVLLGDLVQIKAGGTFSLQAVNNGYADGSIKSGNKYALATISDSSQPTYSYYDTGVQIGNGVKLTGGKALEILSRTNPRATSVLRDEAVGLGFALSIMYGENNITETNNLDIGENATISAHDNLDIKAMSSINSDASTIISGNIGMFSGTYTDAVTNIKRTVRVNLGNNSNVKSDTGSAVIRSITGEEESINTYSSGTGSGLVAIATAYATTDIDEVNQVNIGGNVTISGQLGTYVEAIATSNSVSEKLQVPKVLKDLFPDYPDTVTVYSGGISTKALADSSGLGVSPQAYATTKLKVANEVNIAKGWAGTATTLGGPLAAGAVTVRASDEAFRSQTYALTHGKAGLGTTKAEAITDATVTNTIYIDNTKLLGRGGAKLQVDNGLTTPAWFKTSTMASLTAAGGSIYTTAVVKGHMRNEIQTHDKSKVTYPKNKFTHTAANPHDTVQISLDADYDRLEINFGLFKVSTTKQHSTESMSGLDFSYRCDFCDEGVRDGSKDAGGDVVSKLTTEMAANLQKSIEKAMKPVRAIASKVHETAESLVEFDKALSPLLDSQATRAANMVQTNVTKAHYGEIAEEEAGALYNTNVQLILSRDMVLEGEDLEACRLWNSTASMGNMDMLLLPNATRLQMRGARMLQYVSEAIRGDAFDDGMIRDIDVITALTSSAYRKAELSVSRESMLDFTNGTFSVAEETDVELFLDEISGEWLREKLDEGYIRVLFADQEAVNEANLGFGEVPEGELLEGLTERTDIEAEDDNAAYYWIGRTPEDAENEDAPLYFLQIDKDSDEVKAFRTSASMLDEDEEPVEMSLCLFRDDEADRMGEEKYDVMLFDTPDGEKNLVKLITDLVGERRLEVPITLRVKLRGFALEGADYPAYMISGHVFVMNDGTKGTVSLFDGFYEAEFDGDVFESDYIRIEGISTGDLKVTIKKGQPVWAEFDKALFPFVNLDAATNGGNGIPAARFTGSENKAVSDRFATDLQAALEKDARIEADELEQFRLQESENGVSLYEFPNSAMLIMAEGGEPLYVSDALHGDVMGTVRDVEVITALNEAAAANPVISLGERSSLDLQNGILNVAEGSGVELPQYCMMGDWLLEQLNNGNIRTLIADQDAINSAALGESEVPAGIMLEGLQKQENENEDVELYWIGRSPEEVEDGNARLYLLVLSKTDGSMELGMLTDAAAEGDPFLFTEASAYIFPAGDSYEMMVFATPEDKASIVKLVAGSAEQIPLRAVNVNDNNETAYGVGDHYYMLTSGTDGELSALNGFYKASFDGDRFESDYTVVEGIEGGNLSVTIKENQPVWPVRTEEDAAKDLNGVQYLFQDGEWYYAAEE